jgi:hypothetical protein
MTVTFEKKKKGKGKGKEGYILELCMLYDLKIPFYFAFLLIIVILYYNYYKYTVI